MNTFLKAIASVALLISCSCLAEGPTTKPAEQIRVLARVDDLGVAQAIDDASIQACTLGIARSAEVIVPAPWFLNSVRLLKENPKIDVGVHLALTSEWQLIKWRPITPAPSLVEENGYFRPSTRQDKDLPPGIGFLESKYKLEEVEAELRAQIEMAMRNLPGRVTHVSYHMNAAWATPQLRLLTTKLASEYHLKWADPKHIPWNSARSMSGAQKVDGLAETLERLPAGDWLLITHVAIDTPEMRRVFQRDDENVSGERAGVLAAVLNSKVKDVIARRKIQLISYADLPDSTGH